MRSQGRMDVTALASLYETTYGDRHVRVAQTKDTIKFDGKTDQPQSPSGGSSFTTIGGECDLHVGGAFFAQTEKNYELTVKGDGLFDFEKNWQIGVNNQASLKAGSIVLDAATQITLKVGGSSIVITNGNIFIWGPPPTMIDTTPGAPASAPKPTLQNVADAATADSGDPARVRKPSSPPSGGGGKRGTHTAHVPDAPPVTKVQREHEREEARRQMSFDPGGQSVDPLQSLPDDNR
jgi:hypothetical protein